MSDCSFTALIPNPTEFERKLEEHAASKYCHLKADIIRDLHDPFKCPAKFLPWLAYALSVDVWNDNWPESIKRSVCANSLQLHRVKGTHGGLLDALWALGIRAEITYWHELTPPAPEGTMVLTLLFNDSILHGGDVMLDAGMLRDIRLQLERSKRASIHYTFRIKTDASESVIFGFAVMSQALSQQHINAQHVNTRIDASAIGFTSATSAQVIEQQFTDAQHVNTCIDTKAASFTSATSAQLLEQQFTDAQHVNTCIDTKAASFTSATSAQVMEQQFADAQHVNTRIDASAAGFTSASSIQSINRQRIESRYIDARIASRSIHVPRRLGLSSQLEAYQRLITQKTTVVRPQTASIPAVFAASLQSSTAIYLAMVCQAIIEIGADIGGRIGCSLQLLTTRKMDVMI